jgi:hypothetical protein
VKKRTSGLEIPDVDEILEIVFEKESQRTAAHPEWPIENKAIFEPFRELCLALGAEDIYAELGKMILSKEDMADVVASQERVKAYIIERLLTQHSVDRGLLRRVYEALAQEDAPSFDFSLSRQMATNLPNRCPVMSFLRLSPFLHPQDRLDLFNRAYVSLVSNFPQSQRHSQMLNRLPLVFSMTVRLPNRRPDKSAVPNFSRQYLSARSVWLILLAFLHPQDTTLPRLSSAAAATFVFPHVQRQSQCAPGSSDGTNSITVRCPKTLPDKSLTLPIAASNNSAPYACPAKLPRRRIQHKGRGYQYSTRARRLGNPYCSTEGAF